MEVKIIVSSIKKQIEIACHITEVRNQAKQCQQQAKIGLGQAIIEVEKMILGEDVKDVT